MMLTDFLLTWELSLTMILAITMALVFLIHMAYGVGSNYPNNPNLEPVLVLLDVNDLVWDIGDCNLAIRMARSTCGTFDILLKRP